jgi:anaerobic ribonucleoside-triphosphate reductase activating protein
MTELKISGIIEESIADGYGVRYVVFTQGCFHNCPECHNPQTHDPNGGKTIEINELFQNIIENPLLKGVTFSGGEPFLQPEPLVKLAKMIKNAGLDVTTYTGYTYEQLIKNNRPEQLELLEVTDMLVDGPFIKTQKDLTLMFRGSRNQRILMLENGEIQSVHQVA